MDFLLQNCHGLCFLMSAVDEGELAEVKVSHGLRALFFNQYFFLFEKRMCQDFFNRGSLFWVRTKQSSNKVLWILRKAVRKTDLMIDDIALNYPFCKSGIIYIVWWCKWCLSNKHLIQEYSQGPEIKRLIMKVSFDHFWCQIVRCAAVSVSYLIFWL